MTAAEVVKLFYYRLDEDNTGKYRKVPVVISGTVLRRTQIPPAGLTQFMALATSRLENMGRALMTKIMRS